MYNKNSVKANIAGRQGDVLIVRVGEVPNDAKPRKSRILAEGEATGHHHVLDRAAAVFETARGEVYFTVAPTVEEVGLRHQEHAAILFGPGSYKVIRQVEYDGEDERRVMD